MAIGSVRSTRSRWAPNLRSVVPGESPSSWLPDAPRSQAVAARTYALWHAAKRARPVADICDTTACQAYRGIRALDSAGRITRTYEAASTVRAVLVTGGQWLSYRDGPARTEFSASNGGHSTTGGVPYLPARPDPWDGAARNTAHTWAASIFPGGAPAPLVPASPLRDRQANSMRARPAKVIWRCSPAVTSSGGSALNIAATAAGATPSSRAAWWASSLCSRPSGAAT